MWLVFIAVNKKIIDFKDWKSKVTLVNAIAWGGGLIGFITSLSGGFDWVAPRVIARLTDKADVVATWQAAHHGGAKALVGLFILVCFYLLVFSIQALVLLSDQSPPDFDWRAKLAETTRGNSTPNYDYLS